MTVSQAFRYGSKHYEKIGDCVLTEDNAYMIVLFNTRHYTNYEPYTGTYKPIPTTYTYSYNGGPVPGDDDDPYYWTDG